MRKSFVASVLVAIATILTSSNVVPQDRRLLIVSPIVGPEIDRSEQTTYRLFRSIAEFKSAQFYQMPDSSFWVWVTMQSAEGNVRDSAFQISYQTLERWTEQIDHQQEFVNGSYVLGSQPVEIFYADGGRLMLPSRVSTTVVVSPLRHFVGGLPLSRGAYGLSRPMFQTTHVDLSVGISWANFSGLNSIASNSSNTLAPVSLSVEAPFGITSPVSFVGGWGFALGGANGGTLTQGFAFFLYRTLSSSSFSPFIGIGATETSYDRDIDSLIVSASIVSPVIVLGTGLVQNQIDLVFVIPLKTSLSTEFEKKSYSFEPTGIRLSLFISLR